MYGKYSGWVTDENGIKTEFSNINGIFEVSRLKW